MVNKIHIILNPVAGGGKTIALIEPLTKYLENKWPGNYEILQTKAIGDAIQMAKAIEKNGTELIVVVGGDGTISEVVNGLLCANKASYAPRKFGIVNCGSGAGFAQSLGLPSDFESQITLINNGRSFPLDVGVVTYNDAEGITQQRYFISECQIGIGAAVVFNVGMKYKRLGGKMAFGSASVSQIFQYKATNMKVRIDNKAPVLKKLIGVVVGNGRYTAGGMQLTPSAKLNDGFLDVLKISEMNLIKRLLTFSKVYSGDHVKSPDIIIQQAREIHIESDIPVWIEADGELLGKTPCAIRILPSAIHTFSPLNKPLS